MSRLNTLREKMSNEYDAVMLTNPINQRYMTGFDFEDGYVIISKNGAYLLCDSRYIEAAKNGCSKDFNVVLFEGGLKDWFPKFLKDNDISSLGFEDCYMTCVTLSNFKDITSNVTYVPIGGLVDGMREYKDNDEIENIIKAQRIAEKAFEHILGFINPDRTEIEVALELEFFMRKNGAEGASFKTIAVSGSASSLPHGVPRDIKLEKGFFTMDFGALYNGYCSDMTRTICLGKADDDMKKIYNTVLNAQTCAYNALYDGITGKEADKVARDIIYGEGYEGCFGHSLGHGVGMYIHEAPWVSPRGEKPLTNGHVITLEPGIYIEGKYGCRIEDMAIFHDGKIDDITMAPHELIEL